ncbi:hypothetical protein AAMO2058_000230500 [Amorphochlora amoebiformis]
MGSWEGVRGLLLCILAGLGQVRSEGLEGSVGFGGKAFGSLEAMSPAEFTPEDAVEHAENFIKDSSNYLSTLEDSLFSSVPGPVAAPASLDVDLDASHELAAAFHHRELNETRAGSHVGNKSEDLKGLVEGIDSTIPVYDTTSTITVKGQVPKIGKQRKGRVGKKQAEKAAKDAEKKVNIKVTSKDVLNDDVSGITENEKDPEDLYWAKRATQTLVKRGQERLRDAQSAIDKAEDSKQMEMLRFQESHKEDIKVVNATLTQLLKAEAALNRTRTYIDQEKDRERIIQQNILKVKREETKIEDENKELVAKNKRVEEDINATQNRYQKVEALLQDKLVKVTGELSHAQNSATDAQNRLNYTAGLHNETVQGLMNKAKELADSIESIKKHLYQSEEKLEAKKDQLDAVTEKFLENEKDQNRVRERIRVVRARQKKLKDAQEKTVSELSSRLHILNDYLQSTITALQGEGKAEEAAIALRPELSRIQETKNSSDTRLTSTRQESVALTKNIHIAKNEMNRVVLGNAGLKPRFKGARKATTGAKHNVLEAVKDDVKRATDELTHVQMSVESIRRDKDKEKDLHRRSMALLRKQVNDLKQEVEQLKDAA